MTEAARVQTGIEARRRAITEAAEAVREAQARAAEADGQLTDVHAVNQARRAERLTAADAGADVAELKRLDRLSEDGARREEVAAAKQRQSAQAVEAARTAHAQAVESLRAALARVERMREILPELGREIHRVEYELENVERVQEQRRARFRELRGRREGVRRELEELTGQGT